MASADVLRPLQVHEEDTNNCRITINGNLICQIVLVGWPNDELYHSVDVRQAKKMRLREPNSAIPNHPTLPLENAHALTITPAGHEAKTEQSTSVRALSNSSQELITSRDFEPEDAEEQQEVLLDSVMLATFRRLAGFPREVLSAVIPFKNPNAPRISLVLDLDETLVHCSTDYLENSDANFVVTWEGVDYVVYARKRPGLNAFLATVALHFEVIIFTASQKAYADKLLNILDPTGTLITHRVFREACVNIDGNYLKDLSVLGRDMASTVIVDNSPQAFCRDPDNGIPIGSWYDDPKDTELADIVPFLMLLKQSPDVRPIIREKYRLKHLADLTSLA